MRYGILIIFLGLLIQLPAQQQNNYTFRHIDQADGLLQNNVFGIRQDAKGFIWILTSNGLQRFDGTRFINYPGIMNNAATGITNRAELYVDNNKDEIWVLKNTEIE